MYEWWVLSCIYSAHRYLVIKQHFYFSTVQVEYRDDDGSEIDCDFPSDPPTEEDMCSTQTHRLDSVQRAVVWWVVVFTTVFETLHSLPLRAIQWLLKFLLCVLTVIGMFSPKINHVADAFLGRYLGGLSTCKIFYLCPRLPIW